MIPMRIAHVVFPRPEGVRPVLGFTWDAVQALSDDPDLDVEVLMPVPARGTRAGQSLVRKLRGALAWPEDLEARLLALEPRPTLVPYLPVPGRSLEAAAVAVAAKLVARKKAERPAVLHGSFLDQGGFAAVTAARVLGVPSIAVAHGSDVRALRGELGDPGRQRRAKSTVEHATTLLAVSSHLAQELALAGARADVVRFTTPAERFPERPFSKASPREVLFVGHVSRAKGVDVLIEAFSRVPHDDAVLRLVGPPSSDLDARALAERAGVASRVFVEHEVHQEALAERYARATCVVLPSRTEGFGIVLVEALLVGRPVVGSDLGGIRDIVDPSVGRLVAAEDPVALADAIDELLVRTRRGDFATSTLRAKALPMTWEVVGPELARLVKSLGA